MITRHRRRGMTLVYVLATMMALLAISSLAVDWACVQVARTELQRSADAAALAGATGVREGLAEAIARARAIVQANSVAGGSVSFQDGDLDIGTWDRASRTFTAPALPGKANAVRVVLHKTRERGGGVGLFLARTVGIDQFDIRATAIARAAEPADPRGLAGIDWFRSQGLLTVDSYPTGNRGHVVSNGDITLNLLGLVGITSIRGDARPGQGHQIKKPLIGITHITGSTASLNNLLQYPAVDDSLARMQNNNDRLPPSALNGRNFTAAVLTDIPAGTYSVDDFTLLANVVLRINGPTTFYISGRTTLAGSVLVLSNKATDFRLRVAGGGPVVLAANVTMYADIYAPQSPVNILAGVFYNGRLIGRSIDILATSLMRIDEDLPSPLAETNNYALVK